MSANRLRALAAAFLLSAATVGAAAALTTVAAEAAARPQVGHPLQQAEALANAGNISGAEEKIREAESVGGLTARFDVTNVFDHVYQIRNGTGVGVGAP